MSDLEREKFEAWMRGEAIPQWPLSRDPQITDKYHNLVAQQLWEAWLARSESAPSDLRRAWEQGRGNTKSVVFEYGSYFLSHYAHDVVLDEIDKLEYPGESTPTTPKVMPKMLDRARQWLEKHVATVESDQVAHFMVGFANDVMVEAGSPAPAEEKVPLCWQIRSGRNLYVFGTEPKVEPVYEYGGKPTGEIIMDEFVEAASAPTEEK